MVTTVAETIRQYDDWHDQYGFDLWAEYGEAHEVHYDDPNVDALLEAGRIVSLVDYECECEWPEDEDAEFEHDEETCSWLKGESDWVMEGWAVVNVIRRVVLPEGWKEAQSGAG